MIPGDVARPTILTLCGCLLMASGLATSLGSFHTPVVDCRSFAHTWHLSGDLFGGPIAGPESATFILQADEAF